MLVSVYIPSPFRSITASKDYIYASGSTVEEILESIEEQYPGFSHLVFDDNHQLPGHINIYLNNQEIHELEGLQTEVGLGDQLAIIPALAGGTMSC